MKKFLWISGMLGGKEVIRQQIIEKELVKIVK